MNYSVIVPAHNEAAFLPGLLDSLCTQDFLPTEVVLVNDNSTDTTEEIMQTYAKKHPFVHYVNRVSTAAHQPGAKVIRAFEQGLDALKEPYTVLVKLDADLLLPTHYFSTLMELFQQEKVGIAGGFCVEQKAEGQWEVNHPMHKDHVRGAFKAYHRDCFKAIGGLRPCMGWDTVDELLARFHGFSVRTLDHLEVKHLRPLGEGYTKSSAYAQGKAFYRMRYGMVLSFLAALKSALQKGSLTWLLGVVWGTLTTAISQTEFMVSKEEGRFIRRHRWEQIRFQGKSR